MYSVNKLALASIVLSTAIATPAFAVDWEAVKVSRIAAYSSNGKTWVSIKRGMGVPPNSWIRTQRSSRVKLQRGKDVVFVSPATTVWLASRSGVHSNAKLTLKSGLVSLNVKKGRKKRVSVVTQHVTAVVKGTSFSVKSRGSGSFVSVSTGVVGVTDRETGASVTLNAGQSIASAALSAMKSGGGDGGQKQTNSLGASSSTNEGTGGAVAD